jgi:predicted  nucleic acid-binding Zn-ribbon protein
MAFNQYERVPNENKKFFDAGDDKSGVIVGTVLEAGSGLTLSVSDGVTVGSSSTTILAANTNRKDAIIVNDSDQIIYLKRGTGAELNKGIRLNANGGSYEINLNNLYKGIITGICTDGSKDVTVSEGE